MARREQAVALLAGVGAGLAGGLFGVGGGIVLVPLLTGLLRCTQHEAHGTSLAAIGATAIASLAVYGAHGQVAWGTAVLVGLKSRAAVFVVQRWVAGYDAEPLLAVLPGVALDELWDVVGVGERALQAMSVLVARIRDAQEREQNAKIASTRKSLIGSGDRSERIRTYNYPQGRVTDHRINLTLYKMDAIMDGDISELTGALMAEHQAEQLAAMAEENI